MKRKYCSVALIQRVEDDRLHYLLRNSTTSDSRSDFLRFVMADRLDSESFRETAIREVAWQLSLDRKSDFVVANMAQRCIEAVTNETGEFESVHLAIAFYPVHLYKREIVERFHHDAFWRWCSCPEIVAGRTNSGEVIDPEVVGWLRNWNVVQPWE